MTDIKISNFKYPTGNKPWLEERLKELPTAPGCYILRDKNNRILYVGKSKSLRNRVRSYFRNNVDISPRINLMVSQVHDIEIIVTDNESEALTLESNLIKTNKPYFNILLKDDKKYPYLCITWSEEYPRIFITRKRRNKNEKDRFYGPYVDVTLLRKTLFTIKKLFPLRQRPRPLYKDRTCLNYSIGRCPGVCQKKISAEDYHNTVKRVAMIFQGRTNELKNMLRQQMEKQAEKMNYELAGALRDQIKGIDLLMEDQKMCLPDSNINKDVIAIAKGDKLASVQLFQMRSGKLVGRIGYNADSKGIIPSLIIQRVIEEHYSQVDKVEIPEEILIQYGLENTKSIEDWLSRLRNKRVIIKYPTRKKSIDLINLVHKNAMLELNRVKKGEEKQSLALEDLAQLLDSNNIHRRIEGYDISHIQGSDAVGSQVVFIDGLPAKQHYRKYKIKSSTITVGHSDDYLALSEVIRRRFRRWATIKKEGFDFDKIGKIKGIDLQIHGLNDWPDLVMIDGGKGQLSAVMKTLKELGLEEHINICSLAKKKEEIYLPGNDKALVSEKDQLGVQLLRSLRDEAHRFAINFHRDRRSLRMRKSQLSEIEGLGPKRIKILLSKFPSIEAIKLAGKNELTSVPGLGVKIGTKIWEYFHDDEITN